MGKQLSKAAEDVLKKRNRELSNQLLTAQRHRREVEGKYALLYRKAEGVRESFLAFFFAVELLAAQVSNNTRDGRNARTAARQALEKRHVKPPSTLGSSRKREPTKGRRHKKT